MLYVLQGLPVSYWDSICLQVQRIRSDPHSPNRYRTDGTVYNIAEFAQAFKCSKYAKVSAFILLEPECSLSPGIAESTSREKMHILVIRAFDKSY